MLTIQHSSPNSLWNQPPYHTFDYIDEQPIYHVSSNQLTQIPYRFSTRHRNVNGQPPIQSNNDMTLPFLVKFNQISDSLSNNINEQHNDIEILKISVPLLNQYPLIKSTSSVISFDSQIELDEFNQMTFVCIDNESLLVDRQSQNNIQCKLNP
jgi:hypothetical protein